MHDLSFLLHLSVLWVLFLRHPRWLAGPLLTHSALLDRRLNAQALTDKSTNTNLKIEALQLLRLAVTNAPPAAYQPHLPKLMPGILSCAQERYYKVAADALRVCEQLVTVIRPQTAEAVAPELQVRRAPLKIPQAPVWLCSALSAPTLC